MFRALRPCARTSVGHGPYVRARRPARRRPAYRASSNSCGSRPAPPGFLVGLGLALLPVPPLMAAFRWLGRAAPAPLAAAAVLLRLGRLRRRADRDTGQQLRHRVDSHGHRRPLRTPTARLGGDRAGGRGERQGGRRAAGVRVPKTPVHRPRRRFRGGRLHRHRLRLHREHPLPRQRLRRGPRRRLRRAGLGDGGDVLRTDRAVAVRAPAVHGAHRARLRRGRAQRAPFAQDRAAAARPGAGHGPARAVERLLAVRGARASTWSTAA